MSSLDLRRGKLGELHISWLKVNRSQNVNWQPSCRMLEASWLHWFRLNMKRFLLQKDRVIYQRQGRCG